MTDNEERGFNFCSAAKYQDVGTFHFLGHHSETLSNEVQRCAESSGSEGLSKVSPIPCHDSRRGCYRRATVPLPSLTSLCLVVTALPNRCPAPALERQALPPGWGHLLVGTPAGGYFSGWSPLPRGRCCLFMWVTARQTHPGPCSLAPNERRWSVESFDPFCTDGPPLNP